MDNTSRGSSADGESGASTAGGNGGQGVTSSSHSRPGHLTNVLSTRRAHPPKRLGSEVPGPFEKRHKVATEDAPCGVSNAGKIRASSSAALRDYNVTSSSEDHARGRTSGYPMVASATGPPNKRRYIPCMHTRSYLGLFKASEKGERSGT